MKNITHKINYFIQKSLSFLIILFAASIFLKGCGGAEDKGNNNQNTIKFADLFTNYITFIVDSAPIAVSIGDINNDGLNDVAMISGYNFDPLSDFKLYIFLQNINGTLNQPLKFNTNGSLTNPLEALAIGDINNDGKNEVVVGHLYRIGATGSIEIFYQDDTNIIISGNTIPSNITSLLQISDINNDTLLDMVSIDDVGSISVYEQNINNTLNAAATLSISHEGYDDIDIGDINNDNLNDIVVMSGQGFSPNFGFLLQNNNGFDSPVYYNTLENLITNSLVISDLNSDNLKDIAVSFSSSIGIFFQNQSNQLENNLSYPFLDPYSNSGIMKTYDLNNDNKNDLIILHGDTNTVETYLQTTENNFIQELYHMPTTQSISKNVIDVGDINQDSKPDIAIASDAGLVILYQK